jgi:VanZ family protein
LSLTTPIWRQPHFISYWAPPLLWSLAVILMSGDLGSGKNTLGLVSWLSSWLVDLKPAQLKLINFYFRKIGHVLAYASMYVLWFRAFRGHAGLGPGRAVLWSLGFCLLFSGMDEGRQRFFPTRGSSIWDVILDMSGAGLAALLVLALWPGGKRGPVSLSPRRQAVSPE